MLCDLVLRVGVMVAVCLLFWFGLNLALCGFVGNLYILLACDLTDLCWLCLVLGLWFGILFFF